MGKEIRVDVTAVKQGGLIFVFPYIGKWRTGITGFMAHSFIGKTKSGEAKEPISLNEFSDNNYSLLFSNPIEIETIHIIHEGYSGVATVAHIKPEYFN